MKITTLLAVVAAVLLAGCGGARSWREEVLQPDKQIVVIQRYDDLGNILDQEPGNWEFGPPVVGFRLRIPDRSWSGVTWESGPHLVPLALSRPLMVWRNVGKRTASDTAGAWRQRFPVVLGGDTEYLCRLRPIWPSSAALCLLQARRQGMATHTR